MDRPALWIAQVDPDVTFVLGDPPWRPTTATERDGESPAIIVCAAGSYRPGVELTLAPGGVLVAFDGDEVPPPALRLGSLGIYRAPEPRVRFER